mmetsp:Transcript_28528/g.60469  ORF Transcript_28528/g.60469 Transcript_28528/m.60469 type:complete len:161 (-) Transcript_28528:73-555(-)
MLIKRKRNQLKPELNHNQKMKFLFLKKLTALALAATSGANALDGKYVLRGSAGNDAISMESNTCGHRCYSDSDCHKGGYVQCGECLLIEGTRDYQTCVGPPPAPAPAPVHNYFPEGGQCRKRCRHDSDCQKGGYNPCGSCGQSSGTIMHHRCYSPEEALE